GFAIFYFSKGNYTIDGVYGCGPTASCGIRLDHSNVTGTGCGSFPGSAVHVENPGFSTDNIRLQYVEIKGTGDVTPDPDNIHEGALWLNTGQNFYLGHLWVHDQGSGWCACDNTTN